MNTQKYTNKKRMPFTFLWLFVTLHHLLSFTVHMTFLVSKTQNITALPFTYQTIDRCLFHRRHNLYLTRFSCCTTREI